MLRALVLFLTLPTLLMPPGMCVCQFISFPQSSNPRVEPSPRSTYASHPTNPRSDCRCDSCLAHTASPPVGGTDEHPTDGPSRHSPGKHWPGCPAAVGAGPATVILPAVTVPADLDTRVGIFVPVVECVVSPLRTTPVPSPALCPPLFISHCTLLI